MSSRALERLQQAIAGDDFAAAALLDEEIRVELGRAGSDELLAAQRAYQLAIRGAMAKRGHFARQLSALKRGDRRVAGYAEFGAAN